ncbi:MAG: SusC/RagA family TonB-linked outer membrane protein, partial [Tannerellaceae bacterium]
GTSLGTITDLDGLFELSIPGNSRLKISYLGYTDQQINVDGKSKFNIVLREATKALDEVIVVGYGSTSVKKIVSAVTALKGESLQNLPSTTITGSLQGRATGVIVQNQGGEPGAVPKISIRGGGDPIYVIDGVVSNPWDFNMINPVDIESVSVLKDAASLAVYGSRAADGIILVKTKEGRKGRTSIVYSFTAQYSQPTHLPEKIDSYTYASLQNRAASNDGYPDYHVYSEEVMDIIRNQTDPYRYANTDWLSLGLKKFAPEYRHSLSMTGNSKDINYYLSLGIMDQGSLYTSDALNYNRYTLRSNVNTKFDEIGLTVAVNINGALEQKHYPSFSAGSIWDHLFSRTPLMPAFNPDGTYTTSTDHPLVEMDKRSGYTKNDGKFINTQFVADWDLPWVTGLRLGTMFNYRLNDGHDKSLYATAPQYNADGSLYQATKPSMKESAAFGDSYNFEVNANWSKTFNDKHNFEAKGVFSVSESNGSNFWASRKEYLSTVVDQIFAGSPVGQLNSGNAYEGGRMGVVGRLKYDYANRYYVEGSFRYDGSDNFAPGYRWGLFPSIALAWDITE